ncbi:putative ubiquitin-conjugating enzyme E2 [Tetraselmis virus 1]|uniref:E2 ubiquitin-conjugating enzyme n=1 Tax=Tetraselmis virus 1 TaxID=2060617 RepID=A0A2P0VP69_9VIRU|nr:putative ubiquitin-conjugating enzyme E2 [Tetraselmis virus 1]AUF82703.1 putative ubiquitin-conjugating enzyme E2 [Tetraselmis virus 1]
MASRRLQRDLKELADNPITGVHLELCENNIYRHTVRLVPQDGGLEGVTVKVHIEFTTKYPDEPPVVRISEDSPLYGHPNVFQTFICLDMLNSPIYSTPYQGWSSAYTLRGIIMQLYGFLVLDDKIEQEYGGTISRRPARVNSMRDHPTVYDVIEHSSLLDSSSSPVKSRILDLPDDLFDSILSFSDANTLNNLSKALTSDNSLGLRAGNKFTELNTFCFYTKLPFTDPSTILGYCINTHLYSDGNIRAISLAGYDYISSQAYDHGIRKTAWNFPFKYFFPVYICPSHGDKFINNMDYFMGPLLASSPTVPATEAERLLTVMAKLINSFVVELFNSNYNQRFLCDSAMQAFHHLHHLLVAYSIRSPSVVNLCINDVRRFLSDPSSRLKRNTPDLGMLLVKLLLVPMDIVPWSAFAVSFLRELLSRQVRWADKRSDRLFFTPHTDVSDSERISKHLDIAKKSLSIVVLEAWFCNSVSRPSSASFAIGHLQAIKKAYDEKLCCPTDQDKQSFFETVNSLKNGVYFSDFLNRLGVCPPPPHRKNLALMLRQAVVDSYNNKYHTEPSIFIKSREYYDWSNPNSLIVYKGPWPPVVSQSTS